MAGFQVPRHIPDWRPLATTQSKMRAGEGAMDVEEGLAADGGDVSAGNAS